MELCKLTNAVIDWRKLFEEFSMLSLVKTRKVSLQDFFCEQKKKKI